MEVSISSLGDLTMLSGFVTCGVGWRWMKTMALIVCVKIDL